MSTSDSEDVEGLTNASTESSNRSVLQAAMGSWYLWVATLGSAGFAYIAFTVENLTPSATDKILFSFTTLLLLSSAIWLTWYLWQD